MREIKFRAWDSCEQKILYVNDGFRIEHEIDNGLIAFKFADNGAFSPFELMQYTGLKDKNGVEIYEGDILQYDVPRFSSKPSPNPKVIGTEKDYAQIKAVNGGFVFVRKFWWNDKTFPEMGDALADLQTKSWIQDNCEVIGNIYENPELLED